MRWCYIQSQSRSITPSFYFRLQRQQSANKRARSCNKRPMRILASVSLSRPFLSNHFNLSTEIGYHYIYICMTLRHSRHQQISQRHILSNIFGFLMPDQLILRNNALHFEAFNNTKDVWYALMYHVFIQQGVFLCIDNRPIPTVNDNVFTHLEYVSCWIVGVPVLAQSHKTRLTW